MLMRYFYHYENHINFPKFQNKDINPCKLNTITIIIINHGNKMDKPDKYIDIYLPQINQIILYQVDIIQDNDIIQFLNKRQEGQDDKKY